MILYWRLTQSDFGARAKNNLQHQGGYNFT